jgi:hypothetical protein
MSTTTSQPSGAGYAPPPDGTGAAAAPGAGTGLPGAADPGGHVEGSLGSALAGPEAPVEQQQLGFVGVEPQPAAGDPHSPPSPHSPGTVGTEASVAGDGRAAPRGAEPPGPFDDPDDLDDTCVLPVVDPATGSWVSGGGEDHTALSTAVDGVIARDTVRRTDRDGWSPTVVGEATQEIPVHLLFRDEVEALGNTAWPGGGRLPGTEEQPRLRRVPAPASMTPPRTAPPVDTKFSERPGPVLPGSAAVLVGLVAVAGCLAVLWWIGTVPYTVTDLLGLPSNTYYGIGAGQWALLALSVTVALFAFGGLGRGRVGQAWVLTLFGEYRGTVRRTGLFWMSPLLLRRRVDVRLRHWRSEPMPAVDANGTALRVVVLVVWRVGDTLRAELGVRDHEEYLREQVEAAMARVLSQLPADAFHETAPTLRNAEAVGDALTRLLSEECLPVGLDVFSAQPTRIEYAPEIAAAMQRSRLAALDARHRNSVLTAVVDAVDDTVHRLTSRGLVELDDYERKALVKDLTVAFYTGRQGGGERF